MVLIADDDRDIVRFVEVNLRLEGFEVITAHDGKDALAKALDLQPNLILLDVMMPGMDGYEVCTKLRADGRSAHIPVIMLTAKSLSADKVLALTAQVLRLAAQEAAGPDGFVGHIGGDDFVALVPPEAAEVFSRRVIESFDARILSLYD